MKILIATSKYPPTQSAFDSMCLTIRDCVNHESQGDLKLEGGILWTHGRGCTNLAFEVNGVKDEIERFAMALTMGLMPAKWTETFDPIPNVDTWELGDD